MLKCQQLVIVGILKFISLINTTFERLQARNFFICRYFSVYDRLKFRAQLSWAWKKFYNLGARPIWGQGLLNVLKVLLYMCVYFPESIYEFKKLSESLTYG